MKVITWPLSSQAPRPTMILRPSAKGGDARLERRRLPKIERIDRLHVIVAVEQHLRTRRPAAALADHHRMTRGRPHRGLEAETAEIAGDEFGGRAALRLIGGIGGDRLNSHELEQALEAAVEIGIDPVENGRQGL